MSVRSENIIGMAELDIILQSFVNLIHHFLSQLSALLSDCTLLCDSTVDRSVIPPVH